MKITVIDVFVLVLLGLSLFSFSTKYSPKYEFEYSGSQILKVVRECDIQDSTGALYTVFVKGYWNSDIGHFEEEGFILETGRGFLLLGLRDGRTVSVGGLMSYKEDIQAVDIELRILSKSSVIYVLQPFQGLRGDIKAYIEQSGEFIEYNKEDIAISGVFTIQADISPSIIEESKLEDALSKAIFFMKSADVELHDDGMKIAIERLSMSEYDTFFDIIETQIPVGEIYTHDLTVFYQTSEEIDENDVIELESYSGDSIYPGSIHVRV
ncbi:MAG: hypothetical protein HXS53_12400 [Theionarchaea archaeon]|nr:hypothetical protein [Theionarchaea archaeon]